MKRVRILLLLSIILLGSHTYASRNLDSLRAQWENESLTDSLRIVSIQEFIKDGYMFVDPDSAFYFAELQYNFSLERKQYWGVSDALLNMGSAHLMSNELDQALEYFEKGLEIGLNRELVSQQTEALIDIGIVYINRGQYAKGLDFNERAFALAESNGDLLSQGKIYNNNAVIFRNQGNYPKAIEYFQNALMIQEELANDRDMALAHNNIGTIYFYQGNYRQALEYFQNCLSISESIGDKVKMTDAINNIGNVYAGMGKKLKALEYYQKCMLIHEELDNQGGVAGSLNNFGVIYEELGDYQKALKNFQNGLKVYEEIGDKLNIALTLSNVGMIHEKQGNYTDALDCYQRGILLQEEIGDQRGQANSLNKMGIILASQGDKRRSLEFLVKGLEIMNDLNDNVGIARSLENIGNNYLDLGDNVRALKHCTKSYDLAKQVENMQIQQDACRCLYDAYKFLGDHERALTYLEKVTLLDDSLNVTETAKKLQRFEFDKELLADSLRQEEERHEIELAHQQEVTDKDKTRNMLMGAGLLLLLFTGGLFGRNRYVNRSKKQIQKEKDRSDELLLNILPEEVAEELKEKGTAEARLIDQVTVLFTDFKGFTAMSELLSPKELVDDLNQCFSEFDRITAKYGIEKIKTIGDAYMAAGGLPRPNDTHAKDVIKAAFEMRDFVEEGKAKKMEQGLPYFEVRIGVHTGPVVAGIVGVKKFQYDIWGDTVNTASRMESSGEVGNVNISQGTYEMLKDDTQFVFQNRGKIEAKGKGEMEMWFVSRA